MAQIIGGLALLWVLLLVLGAPVGVLVFFLCAIMSIVIVGSIITILFGRRPR